MVRKWRYKDCITQEGCMIDRNLYLEAAIYSGQPGRWGIKTSLKIDRYIFDRSIDGKKEI